MRCYIWHQFPPQFGMNTYKYSIWGAERSDTVKETAADKARNESTLFQCLFPPDEATQITMLQQLQLQNNWHERDAPDGTETQMDGRSKSEVLPPH